MASDGGIDRALQVLMFESLRDLVKIRFCSVGLGWGPKFCVPIRPSPHTQIHTDTEATGVGGVTVVPKV